MTSCAACGVAITLKQKQFVEGLTFHQFPKNKQLRLQWAKFVKKSNWIPTDYSVLCSDHFSIDSFDQTSATKVLWPTAIPTIEVITLLCDNKVHNSTKSIEVNEVEESSTEIQAEEKTLRPTTEQPSINEDTPCETSLEHLELSKSEIAKTYKIRNLQKTVSRQKKQILYLQKVTNELEKNNAMLEEQEKVLLEHLGGSNTELVKRLFDQTNKECVI